MQHGGLDEGIAAFQMTRILLSTALSLYLTHCMSCQNVQLKTDDSWAWDHESHETSHKNDVTKRMRDHKRRAERDMFLMREADHTAPEMEALPKPVITIASSSPQRSNDSKKRDSTALIPQPRTAVVFVK